MAQELAISHEVQSIGVLQTCFPEKFGVPRQPGLVKEARGEIRLHREFARPEMLQGLEGFSHVWVLWIFHQVLAQGWRPTVRPPRLGGNESVGVFASRSGFRPNHIGLSVLHLEGIKVESGVLRVSGVDVVDGTPVIDIKPYLPAVDAHPGALAGYAAIGQPRLAEASFEYSPAVRAHLEGILSQRPNFQSLLEATIRADPRPAYHEDGQHGYGLRLWEVNVRWRVVDGVVHVEDIGESSND